ncbi:MAG TPA: tetratricopeptide repeat protein [Bryobacteraceae bacterium]|nr:tetratricopeptide repeat protein [Bryobacteraceae bacterium]
MSEQRAHKVVPISDPQASGGASGRLDSWKEIAAYLKRGARTVQRWEREEHLPVHRLQHERLGSVYAYRSELDAWWAARETELPPDRGAEAVASPSVAVLPFVDMSREQDQAYFCEGIAEEIINTLSRIRGLRVVSRTSSFQFRTGSADSREIAGKLGVDALLEGSVRRSGRRLRVSAQLADARSGFELWAGQYDREVSDIFAIQEEIARSIAGALEVRLSAKENVALQTPATTSLLAYECYLRGRKYYYQYSPRDMEFALQLFSRALDLDPEYAQACAGVADCWSYLYLYSNRTEAVRERAEQASLKAVEMDAASAQAQASRGFSLSLNGRNQEAEDAFETAVRLDPGLFEAHYFYARHCFVAGQPAKAAALYREAMRVRPEDFQSPLLVAQIYGDLGLGADARSVRKRGVELAERHLQLNPDDARALYMAANGLVALGEREQGRRWAQRALDLRPDDPMTLYNVGCIFSMLDLVEPALDCLEKAAASGLTQKGWYLHDSNLDALRAHPRFQELLRRLNHPG